MPSKNRIRKFKHHGGKKVRACYEQAIARALVNSLRELSVISTSSGNQEPIVEFILPGEENQTFEAFLQSIEEFINSV